MLARYLAGGARPDEDWRWRHAVNPGAAGRDVEHSQAAVLNELLQDT
ncbi:hypothetical protein I0C86_05255 [Plantactinospora sp. S1510]|uniref:Uncharacterized protein n=1 Tax=Plantactinospora alkalitolerans TaxID=2789879 RepID=A0ABS0GQG5_9ACTN|nr:hypothetical protein [Plantactinospora alkalitolerans]MBF9128400.1 hypothetical protein [Plantactinospora alkalitolerans]